MPLSLDTSFILRPDAAARAREAEPSVPSAQERQQFASALERVQRAGASEASDTSAPTLVRPTRTRLRGDEAASALRSAWTSVRGEPPSAETLSILVGQWAHETGRGASMLNYNFGGLKGASPSGLSTAYSTREGWGDSAVRVVDRFRAYGSAEEGAHDYVSLLTRRYPEAVRAAENGDTPGFVQALKARGYFTDNEAAYSKSVQSLARQALNGGFGAITPASTSAPDLDRAALASVERSSAPGALASADVPGALASADVPGALASADVLEALDAGARLGRAGTTDNAQLAGRAVAPGAFADEVNRAALLMSALRIGEPRPRHG